MSTKVKRGLGLLVVAVIALLIGLAVTNSDGPVALSNFCGLVTVIFGGVGLVMIAWGLLRD